MVKSTRNKGFTLIELLVVVIIVAILAAVATPLLAGNIRQAKESEARASLGTIRTGLRSFFAERGTYAGATFAAIGINTNAGWANGDLDGRYFDDNDYTMPALAIATFCIDVVGGTIPNDAPRAPEVTGLARSMDEQGNIYNATGCAAGGGSILN